MSDWQRTFVPLIEVVRGDVVESVHFGAVAVLEPDGTLVTSLGDPDVMTYLRSSAKPFQLLPLVERGDAERYGFGPRELAVMAASHDGEELHTSLVESILDRIGCRVDDLQCGAHPPYNAATAALLAERREAPSPLHNNCSGKHSGMLALSRGLGAPTETYLDPRHPAQLLIRDSLARWLEADPEAMRHGVDGCGAPAYVAPLRSLAGAFARLAAVDGIPDPELDAARLIARAMCQHPELVGGSSGRIDTELMRLDLGLIAKGGAEGVLCVGIPPREGCAARGLALKIADGDAARRSRAATAAAALRQLGVLADQQLDRLGELARPIIRNVAGRDVGYVRPCFELVSSAS